MYFFFKSEYVSSNVVYSLLDLYFINVTSMHDLGEKRVRGYTRMSGVWGIPDGEFILVEVDPFGNPIGLEGKKLLNAIGSLVRKHQYAPINYLSWKDMPVLYITNMLELIEVLYKLYLIILFVT